MLEIGFIVWGVSDIPRAVEFWSAALDYELKCPAEEGWAMLVPKEGREGMMFCLNRVTSPHARRHHIDLYADDQAAEVGRLLKLGATRKLWNYGEDPDYVVLNDPDGNPFCVVQR